MSTSLSRQREGECVTKSAEGHYVSRGKVSASLSQQREGKRITKSAEGH